MTSSKFPSLDSKWVLVTGGSSGIGYGFAKAFAKRGANLVLVGRNKERLEDCAKILEEKYSNQVEVLSADISTEAGIDAVSDRLLLAHNPITVLVNNAGTGIHLPMASADREVIEKYKQSVRLMVDAPLILGTVAASIFSQRGGGLIVNVGSVNALVPMGVYSALKSFLVTWSQAFSLRSKKSKVQVVTFMPGWTKTQHHQRAGISTKNIPEFLWINANEIADFCVQEVLRGKTYVMPKYRYRTLAFLAKHAPRTMIGGVMRKFNKGRQANIEG